MRSRPLFILLVLLTGQFLPLPPPLPRGGGGHPLAPAAATLELYGTFHAMGVVVTVAATDDPDGDAAAVVEYRAGGEPYRIGFPLSRVGNTRFVGSLFWLDPGTAYDVRVTFSDPDGDPLDGVTVTGTASTRAEITIPAPSRSYYVSPGGSGTACTEAAPCSLAEGINQAQPGEAVVLHGGIYYQDEIPLPRSGTSGAPIVIRGYDGETAILDGADPDSDSFTWTHQGSGVYYTTVNVAGTHLVTANGQRLFPYNNLTDLQNLSQGSTPGFYADDTTLYVHLTGDADPNSAAMVVSRCETAFYVVRDYIYFVDLTFRHYGQGSYPKAIYLDGASDSLVQGCTFASNDIGVGIKRESHRNVIQDNEFYDTIFDWPWDGIKYYAGDGLEDGGITFYDPVTGRGTVIRRNTFHDDFDGFSVCPSDEAAVTNETDVYENVIYNMGDDGVETDGQCSNVRLWGNTFHDVLMGISLAPVYDGPVYAIRNLIYRTGVGNNDYTGSPFKFNNDYSQSGPMYLFHNTADAALPDNNGLYVKAPGTWVQIYARNNVWAGTAYALENYNTGQPIDLDYDDLWNGNSGDLVRWDGNRYATLAAFTAATGQEPHGLSVEPGFADAASGDYTLDPASDLIDAGLIIPGINDDYVGAAPDVGAYEYQGYGFTLAAAPSSRAVNPGDVATYTLSIQPISDFSATINLIAASPSPSLTLSLAPTATTPSVQATLTVTDTHSGLTLLPGLWYIIPITATGGGVTQTASVGLLVGGARVYLPLTLRSTP
jgi:parallel beta-helix repeat protein